MEDDEMPDYSEQGQDDREDSGGVAVAPPPVMAPPQMAPPVNQGIARPPMPGGAPAVYDPNYQDQQEFLRRAAYAQHYNPEGNDLAEAEQTINAAIKFQAMRGYQQDLQSGKSSAEALAKWAPMLFANPKQSNMGGAAALIKATRPPAPMIKTANNQLFQIGPNGAMPLTPAPQRQGRADPFALEEYRQKIREIKTMSETLPDLPAGKDRDALAARIATAQKEAAGIRASASAGGGQVPGGEAPGGEVIRMTKSGRRAVFDSASKRFLRYAS